MSIQAWIERLATPKATLIALAVCLVVGFLTFRFGPFARLSTWGGEARLFDMTADYAPEQAWAILEAFGPEGRALYLRFLALDTLTLCLNGLAGALLLAFALKRLFAERSVLRRLAWTPVLVALLDLCENGGILAMLLLYPQPPEGIAGFTRLVTSIKLALVPATFGVILLVWASLAMRALVQRSNIKKR